jgi:hypothetical protein
MAYRHAASLAAPTSHVLTTLGEGAPDEATELADASVAELAGEYLLREGSSLELDFEHLELRPDGTYVAKVDATLLNPQVRTFGRTWTLPEEGVWNVYEVTGQRRIRVRPTTSKARVYVTSFDGRELSLARRGKRTVLVRGARPS